MINQNIKNILFLSLSVLAIFVIIFAGITIKNIVSFSEGGYRDYAPQIQTGENKIEVTVSITYEIH